MDEKSYLRRRRVPAFGSWDFDDTDYLSYTQCFETARPRRLLRNSFSEHRDRYIDVNDQVSRRIRRRLCSSCERQTSMMSAEPQVLIKNDKWLVNGDQSISRNNKNSGMKANSIPMSPVISVSETKAMDEDLYTISPELLRTHTTKRKKVWGIFSSCIHPKCSP